MHSSDWRRDLQLAIEEGSTQALLDCISRHTTSHAGTPPAAVKREMARRLARLRSAEELAILAQALLRSEQPGAQEVGALLLPIALPHARAELLALLEKAAKSENWEVREWAGSALGALLGLADDDLRPVAESWAASEAERLRRAAVIALMEYGRECPMADLDWILGILGRMLSDPSAYVQANLGPFAIGSALAARSPDAVAEYLRRWVRNEGEAGRVQIALVYTAAAGARLAATTQDVLDALAKDPSPRVQRALRRAQRSISRRTGGHAGL